MPEPSQECTERAIGRRGAHQLLHLFLTGIPGLSVMPFDRVAGLPGLLPMHPVAGLAWRRALSELVGAQPTTPNHFCSAWRSLSVLWSPGAAAQATYPSGRTRIASSGSSLRATVVWTRSVQPAAAA